MLLSANFSMEELTASQVATRWGIDNKPDANATQNLVTLAQMLEKIRVLVGAPVRISSGYRCTILNQRVGGSPMIDHTRGLAADIIVSGVHPKDLARMIAVSALKFDQVIYEGSWVHVGLGPRMRNELLTATFENGVAHYSPRIV
jgi:uncharacterized protein YcbK (DUF882 family)